MSFEYTALVEPNNNRFRASTGSPLDACAEGDSEEEALTRLDSEVAIRLSNGVKVLRRELVGQANGVGVAEVQITEHPLARFAGDLKDDPMYDDWVANMVEYRRQVELIDDTVACSPEQEVEHPLARVVGNLAHNPLADAWLEAMAENRQLTQSSSA